MARVMIRCEDPQHHTKKGKPGWSEILGHIDYPPSVVSPKEGPTGYLCEACADERRKVPQTHSFDPKLTALARGLKAVMSGKPVPPDALKLLSEMAGEK